MEKELKGRIWVVRDSMGNTIDDIDTDMIFHNAHLHITDIDKMGVHAFGNLDDWKDFPQKAKDGDILIVGKNFGAGSSRQQAVDCFKALGVTMLIGESFGAIYKRNAINSAFPLLIADDITNAEKKDGNKLQNGDIVTVNIETGEIFDEENNLITKANPMSEVQIDILKSGGLFAYGKTLEE